jgi:nucleoid-associated protein YgaU
MSDQLALGRARQGSVVLGSAVAAGLGAVGTVLLVRLALQVTEVLAGAGAAVVLTTLSTAACAVVCARLTLSLAVVALTSALAAGGPGRRRGRRVALAISPAWARPAVALLLAAGVTAGSTGCTAWPSAASRVVAEASTATAAAPQTPGAPRQVAAPSEPVQLSGVLAAPGLPDPEWQSLPDPGWRAPAPPPAPLLPPAEAALVTSGASRTGAPAARALRTAEERVVVHRGDSLWTIAARSLGGGASDAEVAAEWPRWWHANRAVIGSDPDLLRPGTRLTPPH